MKGRLLFQETQRFKYSWGWWLVTSIIGGVFLLIFMGLLKNIIYEERFDDFSQEDIGFLLTLVVIVAGLFALVWLIGVTYLELKIDHGGLIYSFYPFISKEKYIRKHQIKELHVSKYEPVTYGGYGYKVRAGGNKAYTLGSKYGLRIVLRSGETLFLGSRNREELEAAVKKLKQNWGMK